MSDNFTATDTTFASYQQNLEAIAAEPLEPYLDRLSFGRAVGSKEFNDPVCGTIHVRAAEVIILDSPVLQRLRRIKQLGVVHYVYAGGTHSRFEHSLGVLHRVASLVDAINVALEMAETRPIDAELEQLLRLTGLCHDLGHGLMSHVSENALEPEVTVHGLQTLFAREVRVENPRLSEMAAYYLIRSQVFRDLLGYAWEQTGLGPCSRDTADFISRCIIGQPIDTDIPLLHETITGPFDADKLDYLKRDALFCGIPDVVDIDRLIQKVRVALVSWQDVPPEIADEVPKRTRLFALTGIAQSGARTLDELALARALQHDRVYRHHKVRAAESMVASILALFDDTLGFPGLLPFRFSDEAFLDLTLDELNLRSEGAISSDKAEAAVDISTRLRERNLFVRGFAWEHSPRIIGLAPEQDQMRALHSLTLVLNRPEGKENLATKIAEEVTNILTTLGRLGDLAGLQAARLKNYIWIDIPRQPVGRSLLKKAFLVARDGSIRRFADDYPDTEGWSDQYLVNRNTGYVFCPRQISDVVYIASELQFRTEFGLRVDYENRAIAEGMDQQSLTRLKRELASSSDFYSSYPTDLWPIPQILESAASGQDILTITSKAAEFAPPATDDGAVHGLTERAVIDFLVQFREDAWIESALILLKEIRHFQRIDFVRSLRRFLSLHPEFRDSLIRLLGTAKDSSAIVTYYSNDIAPEFGMTVVTANEIPIGTSRIVFIDDFIGSGRQVVDIMETWLGLERTNDLGENRDYSELSKSVVDSIIGAELGFVFCAGLEEGPERLANWLAQRTMRGSIHVDNPESTLPTLLELNESGAVPDEFVDYCAEIGMSLLTPNYPGDVAENRKLGYGNKALLVAFPYNVPAHTTTLLWIGGNSAASTGSPYFRDAENDESCCPSSDDTLRTPSARGTPTCQHRHAPLRFPQSTVGNVEARRELEMTWAPKTGRVDDKKRGPCHLN